MPLTDGLSVTEDEAVELALHHAILAARFFEASPDPFPLAEVKRLLRRQSGDLANESIVMFFESLEAVYTGSNN